jgi:hypothetical protein
MSTDYQISIVIGDSSVDVPGRKANSYWIVIVDRRSLKVVYNHLHTDPDTAPDISAYDTDDNMLIVCSIALGTGYVPQGDFYDFLYQAGAGESLRRLVQINQQIGCGEVSSLSYILVGLLGPGRPALPGIELAQAEYYASGPILTAQLIPTTIGSEVIYTPERVGD